MDKLEEIFARQKALDEDIIKRRSLAHISASEWIQKDVLALMDELGEVLNEVNYKWWKNPKPVDEGALKEELADVLHFYISMCYRAGMDADELYRIYMEKNEENFKRQRGLSQKEGYSAADKK